MKVREPGSRSGGWRMRRLLALGGLCLHSLGPAAAAPQVNRAPALPPMPDLRPKDQFRSQLDAGPKIEAERKALEA